MFDFSGVVNKVKDMLVELCEFHHFSYFKYVEYFSLKKYLLK